MKLFRSTTTENANINTYVYPHLQRTRTVIRVLRCDSLLNRHSNHSTTRRCLPGGDVATRVVVVVAVPQSRLPVTRFRCRGGNRQNNDSRSATERIITSDVCKFVCACVYTIRIYVYTSDKNKIRSTRVYTE